MNIPTRQEGARLEAVPVFANGPTGLVQLTIEVEGDGFTDRLTVEADAEQLIEQCTRALVSGQLSIPGSAA